MKPQTVHVGLVCLSSFCKLALAVSNKAAWSLRTACFTGLLPLLLLMLPRAVQAQGCFTCVTNNGAITITGGCTCASTNGVVSIPDTINGWPVTSIASSAFQGCSALKSVTIPDSVTAIGNQAFYACIDLTNAVIGSGVNSFGSSVFQGCTALATVTISNGVTHIGSAAFYGDNKLTSITIPDSVTVIYGGSGAGAFEGCTALTNAIIGNGVIDIGQETFYGCIGLTDVTIGNSIISIEAYAFAGCTRLIGVYFRGNAPNSVGSSAFNSDKYATVYYATGTTGWGTILAGLPVVPWNLQVQTRAWTFGVRTNQFGLKAFGFNYTWESNLVIVVEACTNVSKLPHADWTPVQTNTLTGLSSYFSDTQWTNYPARFYRLRWP